MVLLNVRPLMLLVMVMALTCADRGAAAGPAEQCAARKLQAAGRTIRCRLKSLAVGTPDLTVCDGAYTFKWEQAEARAAAECPTVGDAAVMADLLSTQAAELAAVIEGGPSPTVRYRDNGDGTVTDTATALMWEKLADDGSLHDRDDLYSWSGAFASWSGAFAKVSALNSAAFAGYADWRLPNVNELQSIAILAAHDQPDAHVSIAFHDGCVPGCSVLDCSCTAEPGAEPSYWSSTSHHGTPAWAWLVSCGDGSVIATFKTAPAFVRAVRGGE